MEDHAKNIEVTPEEQIKNLKEELRVSDVLLKDRERLLEAIPECPLHGHGCVPHAIDWINKMKAYEARMHTK